MPFDPFHDPTGVPPVGVGGIFPGMPMPQTHDQYYGEGGGSDGAGGREAGLLDAAGLGPGLAAVTTAREHSGALNRSRSARTEESKYSTDTGVRGMYDSYPPAPQQPQPQPSPYQPQPYGLQSSSSRPISAATTGEDPYAGYTSASPTRDQLSVEGLSNRDEHEDGQHARMEEEEESYTPYHNHGDELRDEEDYGYGGTHRVLKVANE